MSAEPTPKASGTIRNSIRAEMPKAATAAAPWDATRAVTRMVARLATVAIAQATSPTDRMRPNSAARGRTRRSGTKPAAPRSTRTACTPAAAAITAAKATPAPFSPSPAGSISAQASGGKASHAISSAREASACRPPPRSTEARVFASHAGTAPAPNIQAA